ncbi:MAG TPA: PAS domain S-box protein [Oculatellaceae cyanobacterium]|jgi:PAS domain S-box-containing protein
MFLNFKTMLAKIFSINFTPSNSQQAPASIETYNSLLCATLDSTADGIVVVDTQGKIVSYNHTFAEMWGISQAILDRRDDNQILELVQQQLKQPEEFIKKVRELYGQPNVESYDDLELKDGRYLERYSRPQLTQGKSVGRAFSFRDITQRKKAEIALQQTHAQLEIKIEQRTQELLQANKQLSQEIVERQQVEIALKQAKEELEIRVQERTIALSQAIEQLQQENTERLEVQAELEQSLSLLRATLESTTDGIIVVDLVGKITSFNQKLIEMWRIHESLMLSPDDQQALAFALAPLKNAESFLSKLTELSEQPNLHSYDLLEFNDGRIFEYYCQPQRLKEKIIGRVWSFRDVSGRKQAEQALQQAKAELEMRVQERTASLENAIAQLQSEIAERQRTEDQLRRSEERFRNLVETSSDWVWETDKNYLYTYSSPQIYNILGYKPEQVIGKTPFDLMTAQEAWRVANLFSFLTANQQPFKNIETTKIHQDGHPVILERSAVPIFDGDSKFCGYRGIDREITERKQAEGILRQQALAFENIYDGIIITDNEGHIVDWNPSAERMFGYTKEEVLNKSTEFLHTPEQASVITQEILESIKQYDRWTGEIKFIGKNGTQGVCEAVFVPVYNDAGDQIAVIGVNHDITERKQAEIEIRNALLKEKELNQLKSRFISMASHDFRTPLSAIMISSDLLKAYSHKLTDEKKLNHLNQIQTSVRRMTLLLDDILWMGKATSGKIDFKPQKVNLEELCQEVLAEITIADGNKHQFIYKFQAESSLVEMDRKLIQQMLSNLLSNAVKYSPQEGDIRINITCKDGTAIFQVADQGIGIPSSDQARLFNGFQRASNVGNISGTGLGLAIVKNVVDLHQGNIEIDSQEGVGTTITVYLPIIHSKETTK